MIENYKQFRRKVTRLLRVADLLALQNPTDLKHHILERNANWQQECLDIVNELQLFLNTQKTSTRK